MTTHRFGPGDPVITEHGPGVITSMGRVYVYVRLDGGRRLVSVRRDSVSLRLNDTVKHTARMVRQETHVAIEPPLRLISGQLARFVVVVERDGEVQTVAYEGPQRQLPLPMRPPDRDALAAILDDDEPEDR